MGPLPCDVLKGFLNLGATCYLSVVMQCFLHNPLLKNYFLSDKHNNQLCGKVSCMCCELDLLFTEVFSNSFEMKASQVSNTTSNSSSPPIGPVSLLRALWENSADIAGYSQQDAHECFITLLNQLHLGADGSSNGTCKCFIHQIFAGQLESDVKCGKCGHVNPTVDPMLDISLELKGLPSGKTITLASCLRRSVDYIHSFRYVIYRSVQIYRAREVRSEGLCVQSM
jgi:ubiquitin carboxyl-terminal hydrolase 22/27/51